ncbi:substrate-binding domain-containing protein [Bradyrhizobium diazoefficiens]|nr:substrate-binding domain-containing protein [Bradyrhizobium diazoefficiens]UCF55108.1 MAG: substrate-binding domain-containing protein [Bradyrhizobium sp.]MBR0964723.1 substrate-binding domain-containing protein [Bradyrhizobium diazoefficiens]MBR0978896.1 substrate-binding domain-containing protein [Bradyrhizobium diazoefficiens]MBR1006710.1 substrate-binding domain-containing protein [Bradyrhizobium diazoefficiens]MBR1014434.1 substrate-binding domain-containing protein [Bradyrhizobium dia
MTTVNILSGGAAQGLVRGLIEAFEAQTGLGIDGEFGAVGVMADKLRGGTPADLVILTQALLAKLAEEKLVIPSSITDIGRVETALAVRSRDPRMTVKTEADLRDVLRGADAIFVPDIKASTAGQHVAKVLDQIGIAYEVASRLKIFPNGATAMRELAASTAQRPIGCTQATEIIATDGIALSGSLPPGCELVTMYTACVTAGAAHSKEAAALVALLAGADQKALRQRVGFAG